MHTKLDIYQFIRNTHDEFRPFIFKDYECRNRNNH